MLKTNPSSRRLNRRIASQKRAFLNAQAQLKEICRSVEQAAEVGERIDRVEREVFARLLALGLTLLQAFVAGQGNGDAGPRIKIDGSGLRRLSGPRERRYLSIFSELVIMRHVYVLRKGQRIEHVRLGLPEGEFSYVLMDWLQRPCVKESFDEAVADLRALLNLAPSERAAEQSNQHMARDAEVFQVHQSPPEPDTEGEILVATADGKGMPMRRPLEERMHRSHPRRGKGEKANKKQMAYVGAVYSIDRFPRSAADVVDEVCRKQRAEHRPEPRNKQVWAEITRRLDDSRASGRERLFVELANACNDRDPGRQKTLVCLLDGQRALWQTAGAWLPQAVGVLDLFHVLERLWTTARCFHAQGSPEAAAFVSHRLRMLLEGRMGHVIGGLRPLRHRQAIRGEKLKRLYAAITYYEHNREHIKYDEYLAAGYPIGSRVAEGACRHLVRDRMEGTGMRWTEPGA